MFDESHLGHLRFSEFDEVELAGAASIPPPDVVVVEAVVAEEEGREGARTDWVFMMEIFLSPPLEEMKPEDEPNSSWIILGGLYVFADLKQSKNLKSKRESLFVLAEEAKAKERK